MAARDTTLLPRAAPSSLEKGTRQLLAGAGHKVPARRSAPVGSVLGNEQEPGMAGSGGCSCGFLSNFNPTGLFWPGTGN